MSLCICGFPVVYGPIWNLTGWARCQSLFFMAGGHKRSIQRKQILCALPFYAACVLCWGRVFPTGLCPSLHSYPPNPNMSDKTIVQWCWCVCCSRGHCPLKIKESIHAFHFNRKYKISLPVGLWPGISSTWLLLCHGNESKNSFWDINQSERAAHQTDRHKAGMLAQNLGLLGSSMGPGSI